MRTKLLKRLRRKYASYHTILKRGKSFIVDYDCLRFKDEFCSMEDAKAYVRKLVRIAMTIYVERKKYKPKKYYLW